jgi:hypothetical protein
MTDCSLATQTWPQTPPTVRARFPQALIKTDRVGRLHIKVKDEPSSEVKDVLASILQGKNREVWFVRTYGRNQDKDHWRWPIPEMLSLNEIEDLIEDVEDGRLFAKAAPI